MPTNIADYPRPSLTADIVVFGSGDENKSLYDYVLLVKRKNEPFKDQWAIPGGFVNLGESPLQAAARELKEETDLVVHPNNFYLSDVYGDPDRDPRGWVVSIAYFVFAGHISKNIPIAGDDAQSASWVPLNMISLDALAFDHNKILFDAWEKAAHLQRLREMGGR